MARVKSGVKSDHRRKIVKTRLQKSNRGSKYNNYNTVDADRLLSDLRIVGKTLVRWLENFTYQNQYYMISGRSSRTPRIFRTLKAIEIRDFFSFEKTKKLLLFITLYGRVIEVWT